MRKFEDIARALYNDAEDTYSMEKYSPKIRADKNTFAAWEKGKISTGYALKKFRRNNQINKSIKITEDYFVQYITEWLCYEDHHFDDCEQFPIEEKDLRNFDHWAHGEITTEECIRRFTYNKRGKIPNKHVFEEWLERKGY